MESAGDEAGEPIAEPNTQHYNPTEAVGRSPHDSPKGAGKQQQLMGATEWIELVKALPQRDEYYKPERLRRSKSLS